ncbi:MORC family CW-type zinc finger protein 3 [Zea mays]|uniref:MORC family CW-type zinc finger protein 3 n=1 Tax=Zea mays TaxID=4577 RepID=A0A3L6DF62_MAIZE|nr:MORC family CW-type zinc finger protein 3 [Zea mays]
MGSETFDLNEQPHENEGGGLNYVLLQKDCKNICRTKVYDLPIEVPIIWSVAAFVPIKAYQKSDFPKFLLLPYPEDSRQKSEWGKFMRFLSENKRYIPTSGEPPTTTTPARHNICLCDLLPLGGFGNHPSWMVLEVYLQKSAHGFPWSRSLATLRMGFYTMGYLLLSTTKKSGEEGMTALLAAIARCGSSTFHILAPEPDECSSFPHAVLLYECGQNGPGDCKHMAGTSGKRVNSNVMNASKRPFKSDFQYGSRNSKPPHFKEEVCDSLLKPKKMETSPKHYDPFVTEHHRLVLESSPCESVEDSPRVLNPVVKKRMASPTKNFIVADPSYLRTLSQTHASWIFGAIAELIDNSRDAGASRLSISIEHLFSKKAQKKIPVLSVIDDGHGMAYPDIMRMISFGHKRPNGHREDQIGRFGIGFKTGAMKLGKDAIVLTQTKASRSVAFLSQSFNEEKDNLEIPVVAYRKEGQYMEVDLSVQSDATAEYNLNAIKNFSSFNEYFIGEKLGLFGEDTGTQIYIWNLDTWGTDYTLEWNSGKSSENPVHHGRGDILIRSRRVRSRPGQTSNKVLLDYSLQSYLEVMFLNPRMKISVQGSLVKSRPLAKTLNKTSVVSGEIMERTIILTLGRSKSYKRVGGQKHSTDMGRGVIGVADITNLIDDEDGNSWVLNNKQGFQDCEMYAKLEEWLGRKVDEYWDTKFDSLTLRKGDEHHKPDSDWVQCYSCRKWRMLNAGFNVDNLPEEWFCYMAPFNGKCEIPEQQAGPDIIVIGEKRSGHDEQKKAALQGGTPEEEMRHENHEIQMITQDEFVKNVQDMPEVVHKRKKISSGTPSKPQKNRDDDLEGVSSQTEDDVPLTRLKRLRRGPAKTNKR